MSSVVPLTTPGLGYKPIPSKYSLVEVVPSLPAKRNVVRGAVYSKACPSFVFKNLASTSTFKIAREDLIRTRRKRSRGGKLP